MSTILIVEDELEQTKFLEVILSSNHDLIFAESATEGLSAYEKNSPNLLIVDLRLPDYSGFGLIEQVREDNPRVPAIVLSAFCNDINAATAMKLGCFAYIDKRDAVRELNFTIEEALSGHLRISYSFDPKPTMKQFVARLGEEAKDELRDLLLPKPTMKQFVADLGEEAKDELRDLLLPNKPTMRQLLKGLGEDEKDELREFLSQPSFKRVRLRLLPKPAQKAQIEKLFQFYEKVIPWLERKVKTETKSKQELHELYYNELYPEYTVHSQHFNRLFSYFAELLKRRRKQVELQAWETVGEFALLDSRTVTISPKTQTLSLALPPREQRRTTIRFFASEDALAALPALPTTISPLIRKQGEYWVIMSVNSLDLPASFPDASDEEIYRALR